MSRPIRTMLPAYTSNICTFTVGLFCGYLIRKNWFIIRGLLLGKKSSKEVQNDCKKNDNIKTESSPVIKIEELKEVKALIAYYSI